jgi:hypothetical protein
MRVERTEIMITFENPFLLTISKGMPVKLLKCWTAPTPSEIISIPIRKSVNEKTKIRIPLSISLSEI